MVRPLLRTSLPIFALVYGFVACSSSDNDFFGGAAGTNQDAGSSGLSGAGGNAPTSGAGGKSAGTGGNGGSGLSTGGDTGATGGASAGGTTGGAPAGGTGSGGTPSTSGTGGTDEMAGDGGENAAGMGAAGMSEEAGGAGGDGSSGTAGSATGGTAGSSGTAGSATGGTAGSATGGTAGSATGGTAGSATGGTAGVPGCEENTDCDDDEYCKKETCDAAEGTCAPQPQSCVDQNAVFDPVCGCDGMTYFTPCVAAREGVNAKAAGECTGNDLATCNRQEGGASCEPHREGARCYRPRVGCSGTSASTGVCWVIPDQCPENEPQTETYCGGGTGDPECVGLCEILDEDMAVYRDSPACAPR